MAHQIGKGFLADILKQNVNNLIIKRTAQSATSIKQSEGSSDNTPKPYSDVPGPPRYPFVGVIPEMLKNKFDPTRVYDTWTRWEKTYGKIFRVNFPFNPPMVAISDMKDIEKLYKVTMNNPIREAFYSLKMIRDQALDGYLDKKGGILVENNEEWWRVRKPVQVPMMKPKNIVKYLPQMDQVTLSFMDIIAKFQNDLGEMPENFIEELYKWSLESVALVALNRRLGCLEENITKDSQQMQLIHHTNIIFQALSDTELNYPYWRLFATKSYKNLRDSHEVVLKIVIDAIKESEETIGKTDEETLMKTFLNAEGLSKKDVLTIILDMLFAGIDTTSHTIGFSLYCLSRNPETQKKVQEEIDSVLGDGKRPITENDLARLSYLKCCVKESLRMFPLVIAHARTLTEDTVLSNHKIPKGVQVMIMSFLNARKEENFPKADKYIPDRWLRTKPMGPISPYASLPFSHGSRMCIGRRIAEQEIYTFLARALHRFDVDYKYEDLEVITKLVSVPSKPLKFQFTERNK